MSACGEAHVGAVRLLVRHMEAEELGQRDDEGRTALHWAASKAYEATGEGREEVVALLLSKGAQAQSGDETDKTPLLIASGEGHLGVVRILLQHMGGQGLEDADVNGYTALCYAVQGGHEEVVALLVGQGAQANIRDTSEDTPLIVASQCGHMGVVQVLIQHLKGQGLNERGARGTALHHAASKGLEGMVRLLCLAGADPTIRDHQGRTPREWAEEEASGYMCEQLNAKRAACVAVFKVSFHMY